MHQEPAVAGKAFQFNYKFQDPLIPNILYFNAKGPFKGLLHFYC
jgi:hypothetical protein